MEFYKSLFEIHVILAYFEVEFSFDESMAIINIPMLSFDEQKIINYKNYHFSSSSFFVIEFVSRTVLLLTPTNRKPNRWISGIFYFCLSTQLVSCYTHTRACTCTRTQYSLPKLKTKLNNNQNSDHFISFHFVNDKFGRFFFNFRVVEVHLTFRYKETALTYLIEFVLSKLGQQLFMSLCLYVDVKMCCRLMTIREWW